MRSTIRFMLAAATYFPTPSLHAVMQRVVVDALYPVSLNGYQTGLTVIATKR